jgi:hypothetical protein
VADTPTTEEAPRADAGQSSAGPAEPPQPVEPPRPAEPPRPPEQRPPRRALVIGAAFLVPCVVIALGVWSMIRAVEQNEAGPAPSALEGSQPAPSALGAVPAAPESAPSSGAAESAEFIDETDDGEPSGAKRAPPKRYATVHQAATESCSTDSVEGLSKQIIEQARCIRPNAFVPLPSRKNLVVSSNVFPYLELEARNGLVRALDANPSKRMTLNSALRTVAQQYLVSRWGAGKRCGVQLATQPGQSNHEIGAAVDIAEPNQWKSALEAQQFRWLGASDRVHFDFRGTSARSKTATDVLAFQMLWNRNNPKDPIAADGRYSASTEQRLKKAPPGGFANGPVCGKTAAKKHP